MGKPKNQESLLAIRNALRSAKGEARMAELNIDIALERLIQFTDADRLAIAVKALRMCANSPDGARASALRGIARQALENLGEPLKVTP